MIALDETLELMADRFFADAQASDTVAEDSQVSSALRRSFFIACRERVRLALEQEAELARLLAKLRISENQRLLLVGELRHRSRNTLTIVRAVVLQTLRTAESTEAAAETISGRLTNLSNLHERLGQEEDQRALLRSLVINAVSMLAIPAVRLEIVGPDVLVTGPEIVGFSMVLHELATNAVKHGSLSSPNGRVRVAWDIAGGHLNFLWKELDGPRVRHPTREGFGSKLIDRALSAPGRRAELWFLPEGATWFFSSGIDEGFFCESSDGTASPRLPLYLTS